MGFPENKKIRNLTKNEGPLEMKMKTFRDHGISDLSVPEVPSNRLETLHLAEYTFANVDSTTRI